MSPWRPPPLPLVKTFPSGSTSMMSSIAGSRDTSRPWLPSASNKDRRVPQGFTAAIESPGQVATALGL